MLRHSSVIFRFSLVFLISILLLGCAYFLLLQNVYKTQLRNQARTIADNVESFGAWVAQYGRIWVKDNPSGYLGQLSLTKSGNATDTGSEHKIEFFSKNPALAQREFSEVVTRSDSEARFRVTSDNYMNPLNKPDAFEKQAITIIKTQNIREFSSIERNVYRYARGLFHKKSCVTCHGDPTTAPSDVLSRYGDRRGFGFKEGDVAGIISVTLPSRSLWQTSIALLGPLEIGLVLIAFALAYLYIRFGIVRPIHDLTKVADTLSTGKDAPIDMRNIRQDTHNEIEKLTLSVYRLRSSLQIAIRRMRP